MTDFSIRTRLALMIALLLALIASAAGFALFQLRGVTLSLDTVYNDRMLPLLQLRSVDYAYTVTMTRVAQEVRDGHLDATAGAAQLAHSRHEAQRQWQAYQDTYLVPQEKALIATARPLLASADAAHDKLSALLRQRDTAGLRTFAASELYPAVMPLAATLDQLVSVQGAVARTEAEGSHHAYRAALWGLLAMVGLALAVGVGLAWATVLRYARERREGEAAAQHLTRCYAALSQTNQMIMRVREADALFKQICRICLDTGLARVACVILVDGQRGVLAGSAGPAEELLAGVPMKVETEGALSKIPVVEAWRTGQHAISNDYLNDERTTMRRERALLHGVRAMGAFPVRRGGAVVGVLALYVDQVGFFDTARVNLLDEMAGDLSFALDNIDRDAARVQAEQQVEAGYQRLRRVFNIMPVAATLTSLRTQRVLEANAICSERYGIAPGGMVGKTMAEMGLGLSGPDRTRFYDELNATQSVCDLEVQVHTARGETLDLLTSAEITDYLGEPCLITVSLDITERKRREHAERARADAEVSSRAKTEFLSRMSHELRTPLNAVLGFSQLLQSDGQEPLSERQRLRVESIRQAGWHLLALINDVLDVSRIELGQLRVESHGIGLTELLDSVFELMRTLAEDKRVSLEPAYRLHAPLDACGDPLRLRQVMLNLMSNAIKYNRTGGSVRVDVQAKGQQVEVRVVDTGIGMTDEQLHHLYEPFNRLGREHGDVEGIGIGLVLTRQLLVLMQGELKVESQLGLGTTMCVVLPLAEASQRRIATDAAPLAESIEHTGGQPIGVVLYIEDNAINLLLVEQLLMCWPGVQLVQAEDARTGMALARALQPDLILLDMRLPDLSGPEVLKALKADPRTQGLRVVALSASAMPEEVALARSCGAFDYWTKPLDFERFMGDLKRLLPAGDA